MNPLPEGDRGQGPPALLEAPALSTELPYLAIRDFPHLIRLGEDQKDRLVVRLDEALEDGSRLGAGGGAIRIQHVAARALH